MPSMKTDDHQTQRIAKLLARAGIASRREIERMIADGRVAIDGVAIDTPATLLTSLHGVTVDGAPVEAPAPARLFVFHKPAGVLTAERDFSGRPTIYDRLPADLPRLVPVGRLDLGTEGLLLMTTNGGLKRRLELPATGVERAYRARAYGRITQARLEELIEGVEIDGVRYGPIDANLERRTGANVWIEMILTEGKNREVRRVLDHLGLSVSRLIRIRYGPFVLGDLPSGAIGEVRQADLAAFLQSLKLPKAEAAAVATAKPIAVSIQKIAAPKPSPLQGREREPNAVQWKGEGDVTPRTKMRLPRPQTTPATTADARLKPPTRSRHPSPTHHREERDELDTSPPRREPSGSATPRSPKPVRKPGWAKAKPKSRPARPRK